MKQKFTMPDGELVEKDMPLWKTPWNHDTNFESDRTGLYCADESMTKQEFKEETDINVILERFMRTNELPPMALPEHFLDLSGRKTYFEMASQIAEANGMFYTLDAGIRSEFQNRPELWADAVSQAVDQGDGDRLLELGVQLEIRKPQEAAAATPAAGGTPATSPAAKAPEAPASGAPKSEPPK